MILILSSSGDYSVNIVEDWLNFYQASFIRLNSENFIDDDFEIKITSREWLSILFNNEKYRFDNIGTVWFRKFYFTHISEWSQKFPISQLKEKSFNHLNNQVKKVSEFITLILKDKKWLTDPSTLPLNKMYVVYIAAKLGFTIPDTIITNTKSSISDRRNYITKSICDSTSFISPQGRRYFSYTNSLATKRNDSIPDRFLCSLIQEKIEKAYDLRVFYICGNIYSMAIFSQSDEQTKIDFRKYNWEKPNRSIPIDIPDDLKEKIHRLMFRLGLNTGSLDFIKGTDGIYYFLEINPTGQFGMMEAPCNYPLHKIVAETLIKMDSQNCTL